MFRDETVSQIIKVCEDIKSSQIIVLLQVALSLTCGHCAKLEGGLPLLENTEEASS